MALTEAAIRTMVADWYQALDQHVELDAALRYLTDDVLATLFVLPPDLGPVAVKVNRLDSQALVRYYEAERQRWE